MSTPTCFCRRCVIDGWLSDIAALVCLIAIAVVLYLVEGLP